MVEASGFIPHFCNYHGYVKTSSIAFEKKIMATANLNHKEECTLIETFHGEIKLIKRSHANLVTLSFSNLRECLAYVDKNQFEINIMHSGKRREDRESTDR